MTLDEHDHNRDHRNYRGHDHHPPPPTRPAPGAPWSDALVDGYLQKHADHPTNRLAVGAAALGGAETVLDIGCGGGAAVRAAASALPAGKVLGIDPSPVMIRYAEHVAARHPAADRMTFSLGRAEDLPVAAGSIDVVMAINSLYHWRAIEQGLGQVVRVLKPNGRFVVVEDVFAHSDRALDRTSLCRLLAGAGLEISRLSEQAHGDGTALVIVAKPMEGDDQ
ncbi:MAG: class I SAM-dependent methyltransferase [Pseudomonadota bacterium]